MDKVQGAFFYALVQALRMEIRAASPRYQHPESNRAYEAMLKVGETYMQEAEQAIRKT